MRVSIQKIEPNPYRTGLGPLSDVQIRRLIESYKMSDFGKDQRFEVRRNGKGYQLIYGHHRLEALGRFFGKQTEVEIVIRDYDDRMMLQELLRENLTQEDRWFSRMKGMVLAKKFLLEQGKPADRSDIAKFLSKNGQTVSRGEASVYLSIAENLNPELLKEVTFDRRGKEEAHQLSIKQAYYLSRFPDYAEQKDLAKALKKCHIHDHVEQARYLKIYRSLSPSEKRLVRTGQINLALVPNLVKPEEARQIRQLKPELEKIQKTLKGNRLASQLYVSLMDLRDALQKTQGAKFKPGISEILSNLYKEIAKELARQNKILIRDIDRRR